VRLFSFLHASQAPFEQVFFDWRGGLLSAERAERSPVAAAYADAAFAPVREAFAARAPLATANLGHPYFARERPRTMLIAEMEALWAPIVEHDDWSALNAALDEIETMRQACAG